MAYILELKASARVMFTVDLDIEDRLINGQLGTVREIHYNSNFVNKIYVEFDDQKAGMKAAHNQYNNHVPVERSKTMIKIRSDSSSKESPCILRTKFPLMLSWGMYSS